MNKNELKMIKMLETLNEEQFKKLYDEIEKKNKVHAKVLYHYWTLKKKKDKKKS